MRNTDVTRVSTNLALFQIRNPLVYSLQKRELKDNCIDGGYRMIRSMIMLLSSVVGKTRIKE